MSLRALDMFCCQAVCLFIGQLFMLSYSCQLLVYTISLWWLKLAQAEGSEDPIQPTMASAYILVKEGVSSDVYFVDLVVEKADGNALVHIIAHQTGHTLYSGARSLLLRR